MKKIRLIHNPYLNKTDISIDNNQISDGPIFEMVHEKRLQVWLADFFPKLNDYCNDDSYEISFMGIDQDFNDLVEVARSFDFNITLEHLFKEQADPDRKTTQLRNLFEKAKQGPIDDFKTDEIDHAFKNALKPEFEICVVATMSAGKSTLINAMLGEDLQPSENSACTATITTIADYDNMPCFRGRVVNGGDENEWFNVDKAKLKEWNTDRVPHIEIQGNIPMIKSENVRLVLVDTPGPNNSMNYKHRECTIGAIKNDQKPMILYILNATQLSTTDDQTLLNIVSHEMKQGGKQSHDRFMFVVNKIDEFDPEKEDIPSNLSKVRNYLEENGLPHPNIYPISARLSKLIREYKNGIELTRSEKKDMEGGVEIFNEIESMSMVQYMPLSPTVKKIVNKRIVENREGQNSYELAMLNSGVPVIEEVIQEYLIKYALPAKIFDAKMSFEHILRKHETFASLDKELRQSIDNLGQINKQIEEIQEKLNKGNNAKQFKTTVQSYSWQKSKDYVDKVRSIEIDFNKSLNEFQKQLGSDEISPKVAESIMKGIANQASFVISNIQIELDRIIHSEVLTKINNLKDEYNSYVRDVIGEIGDISPVMRELTKSVQYILDTSKIIQEIKETRREKSGGYYVSTSKWWNPFSWGSKEWVNTYENKEIVDSQALYHNFANELRAVLADNVNQAEKAASEQVEECKMKFIKQMDNIDSKIDDMLRNMREKTSSKQAFEENLKENESKMLWLENFQEELDNVLSI
ncbi:MAG: dynamin family protein [Candidatus Cloacimonetes bacterium]|nr:dynamin family protein [Candidatus Cloacimonadota bacterium]